MSLRSISGAVDAHAAVLRFMGSAIVSLVESGTVALNTVPVRSDSISSLPLNSASRSRMPVKPSIGLPFTEISETLRAETTSVIAYLQEHIIIFNCQANAHRRAFRVSMDVRHRLLQNSKEHKIRPR